MRIRTRYLTLAVLFLVTAVSFADRSMLSLTGSAISRELRLTPVALGYIFSAFGWAYAAGQIPGGWLLDRFGSRRIYILSVFSWSVFVFFQTLVGYCPAAVASFVLFALLFLMGLCEAPVFPANSRIVAAWFPTAERGTAAAVFNSAQYLAAALFGPLMGWITHTFGWRYVFLLMGAIGFAATVLCVRSIYNPRDHRKISITELADIEQGGALIDMDRRAKDGGGAFHNRQETLKILLGNRMLLGVYIGTYCVTAVMYFFLTWLPIYLQARGMSILKAGAVIALPALCGFSGGISGGVVSDYLLRKGHSLTFARKAPIVVGMLLVLVILACNYVSAQWAVVLIMALAYFGKAFGSLGWAVIADAAPKQIAGLTAGVFNTFANIAAITTPIVIGYIVQATGSFKGVMIFLAANALAAIFSYLLIVGEIKRVELH
ncbi:MAG: MFS transporter [Terriglobia bacterium]|jgi:ACS family glucarate transporter-like MFS transporter